MATENNFTIEGSIIRKGSVEEFGTFKKQELVLEIQDGKFTQLVSFEVVGQAIQRLEKHEKGDNVEVTYNLRGREWTNKDGEVKYFNSLNAWKVAEADFSL